MPREYVRELEQIFDEKDLNVLFEGCKDKNSIKTKLLSAGILRTLSKNKKGISDESEDYVDISKCKKEGKLYNFKYVGVISIQDFVVKVYPKYIEDKTNIRTKFKQIIKVIERYSKSKPLDDNVDLGTKNGEPYNRISMMVYILNDYMENGVYTNTRKIIENNGNGDINWNRTINDTYPIITNNRPYYVELKTYYNIRDDNNYFKLLHEYIVTRCSKALLDDELLDIFGLDNIILSDLEKDDFGNTEYILYRLNSEKNVQYNTTKQRLLDLMIAYVSGKFNKDAFELSLYGTKNFHNIWEDVCKDCFDDLIKKDKTIGEIEEYKGLNPSQRDKAWYNVTLLDKIEKPIWNGYKDDNSVHEIPSPKTLVPDIVTIYKNGSKKLFCILDAKYYHINIDVINNRLRHCPGIGDITKQFLYQYALKDLYEAYRFNHYHEVRNAFLMPSDSEVCDNSEIHKGYVSLDMFVGPPLNLKAIQVFTLPACVLYKLYLGREERIFNIENLFPLSYSTIDEDYKMIAADK